MGLKRTKIITGLKCHFFQFDGFTLTDQCRDRQHVKFELTLVLLRCLGAVVFFSHSLAFTVTSGSMLVQEEILWCAFRIVMLLYDDIVTRDLLCSVWWGSDVMFTLILLLLWVVVDTCDLLAARALTPPLGFTDNAYTSNWPWCFEFNVELKGKVKITHYNSDELQLVVGICKRFSSLQLSKLQDF